MKTVCEFKCPSGYDMVWVPYAIPDEDGWYLDVTGKWKLSDNGLMYIEAVRYWPPEFLDKLIRRTPSNTDWYGEREVRFMAVSE